jgi:hypothetical protein
MGLSAIKVLAPLQSGVGQSIKEQLGKVKK